MTPNCPDLNNAFDQLRLAYEKDLIDIRVNLIRLNRPDSPVYRWADSNLPCLLICIVAITGFHVSGWKWGLLSLFGGLVLFLWPVRKMAFSVLESRAYEFALSSQEAWQRMWDFGGLACLVKDTPDTLCQSPKDDWAVFVTNSLAGRHGGTTDESTGNTDSGVSSRPFEGERPSRGNWGAISLRITQGLDEVRKTWFSVCLDNFRETSNKAWAEDPPIIVKQVNLAGDAARASKAYQLYLVSGFLAQQGYIPPNQGRDFADILFAQVCGTELQECLAFFARYHEAHGDPGSQLFRFGSDISRYITGNDAPLVESMLVASTIPLFAGMTRMVVADAFGDQGTVAQLQAELRAGEQEG